MSLLTRIEQDALIQESLPIVGHEVSYMLRRVPGHVQKEDLVSAGTLALVQAARSFDPDRGVPFVSYASIRIRGAITDELRAMDWVSRDTRHRLKKINEARSELTMVLGRAPHREYRCGSNGGGRISRYRSDAGVACGFMRGDCGAHGGNRRAAVAVTHCSGGGVPGGNACRGGGRFYGGLTVPRQPVEVTGSGDAPASDGARRRGRASADPGSSRWRSRATTGRLPRCGIGSTGAGLTSDACLLSHAKCRT